MLSFYLISVFIIGLIMGSFFNVVIYRVPHHESIVYGSSHCPNCKEPIKPYDLIPVLSFILLKGKCRHCHQPISLRYPFVELLTGIAYALVYWTYRMSFATIIGIFLASLLILIAMIDIDTMEIYDRFQIMLLLLAFAAIYVSPLSLLNHIVGFFIISLPFFIIATLTQGLGGGDIKLIAIAGLLLGYQAALIAFFIASVTGGMIAVYLLLTKQKQRKSMIAFGPYLCLGIYFAYLYGQPIFTWYLSFFN